MIPWRIQRLDLARGHVSALTGRLLVAALADALAPCEPPEAVLAPGEPLEAALIGSAATWGWGLPEEQPTVATAMKAAATMCEALKRRDMNRTGPFCWEHLA